MAKHYFEKGIWRKQTELEKKKFKPKFDKLRKELEGWCFSKNVEFIEEINSEGKNRLILASRDDNGIYGVTNSCDIEL